MTTKSALIISSITQNLIIFLFRWQKNNNNFCFQFSRPHIRQDKDRRDTPIYMYINSDRSLDLFTESHNRPISQNRQKRQIRVCLLPKSRVQIQWENRSRIPYDENNRRLLLNKFNSRLSFRDTNSRYRRPLRINQHSKRSVSYLQFRVLVYNWIQRKSTCPRSFYVFASNFCFYICGSDFLLVSIHSFTAIRSVQVKVNILQDSAEIRVDFFSRVRKKGT